MARTKTVARVSSRPLSMPNKDRQGARWLRRGSLEVSPSSIPRFRSNHGSDDAYDVENVPKTPTPKPRSKRALPAVESVDSDPRQHDHVAPPSQAAGQVVHRNNEQTALRETSPDATKSRDVRFAPVSAAPRTLRFEILDHEIEPDNRVTLKVKWVDEETGNSWTVRETEWDMQERYHTTLYAYWARLGGRDRVIDRQLWHPFKLWGEKLATVNGKKVKKFETQWVGYPRSASTWETQEFLHTTCEAQELIDEYLENRK